VNKQHYQNLENMYLAAPINNFYGATISISDSYSEIEIEVKDELFHSAGAVHGSVYFKLLDDSAFFAANSLEKEFFVLTSSFNTYLTRPISSGKMKAVGKIVNVNRSQFIAESVVYNSHGKEIARGSGVFVRSKMLLDSVKGYKT
jgi:uncharacterized protein (TIGR00369 family)